MTAELKVIGTGFGRTGTDSMRAALDQLGFGPCHHMRTLVEDPDHAQMWRTALQSGRMDWDQLLAGQRACVDWPTAHFWPELIARFPTARVLLTWRDADSWWRSFEKTILPELVDRAPDAPPTTGTLLIPPRVFGGLPMTRQTCIAAYERNVARVRSTVPPDRLLHFTVGDGWEPLCRFLDVEVPDTPFPHRNTATEFHTSFQS